jgi:hypothetical protein
VTFFCFIISTIPVLVIIFLFLPLPWQRAVEWLGGFLQFSLITLSPFFWNYITRAHTHTPLCTSWATFWRDWTNSLWPSLLNLNQKFHYLYIPGPPPSRRVCVNSIAAWAGLSNLIICMERERLWLFISLAGESQCTFTDPPIHYVSGPPGFWGGPDEMDGFGGWKTIHTQSVRGCVCLSNFVCV